MIPMLPRTSRSPALLLVLNRGGGGNVSVASTSLTHTTLNIHTAAFSLLASLNNEDSVSVGVERSRACSRRLQVSELRALDDSTGRLQFFMLLKLYALCRKEAPLLASPTTVAPHSLLLMKRSLSPSTNVSRMTQSVRT